MKKLILFVAVALCISTGTMAQGVSGGIKAGLNFANQKLDDDDIDINGRTSWHAGFFLTAKLGTIGIQPEILYNSVGSKFDAGTAGDLVTKIDYVTIPVMIRINFAKVLNIHAGPQFGILLSAKQELDGNSEDIKDTLKGSDLGIGAGIGLDLPMGLTASARYTFGLSDINDSDDIEGAIKNNVLQLSVGYKLFGK
jgi:hypothetical protein